jgi:hypothetical protein
MKKINTQSAIAVISDTIKRGEVKMLKTGKLQKEPLHAFGDKIRKKPK